MRKNLCIIRTNVGDQYAMSRIPLDMGRDIDLKFEMALLTYLEMLVEFESL